ncbi:MAG TPA: ATP cone domain-containing protein [Methanomicrobiales archaeon]|nr:ATP cone domain-containing protein [Methanomicrobiales archaeon]
MAERQFGGMQHTPWEDTNVIKGDGKEEKFDPNKIKQSVMKAGGDERLASDIAEDIGRTTHINMHTSEIDHDVQYVLKRRDMDTFASWVQWKEEHGKMP